MFGLIRRLRRRKLAKRPFPEAWLTPLQEHVPFFSTLDSTLRQRFLLQLKIFVWEKTFIGAGGLEITDEIRVVIAATAIRLTVHLDLGYYDRLTEVIVYPSAYKHPDDDESVILGEAHDWGMVVLAWDAVLAGLSNPDDGLDTATHEFAHVLDRGGGAFDGTPELRHSANYRCWAKVMSQHFTALRGGQRKLRKVLRSYGEQNEAEFFAVASEAFFEKPEQMKEHAPDLYAVLARFYGWDPAGERESE